MFIGSSQKHVDCSFSELEGWSRNLTLMLYVNVTFSMLLLFQIAGYHYFILPHLPEKLPCFMLKHLTLKENS